MSAKLESSNPNNGNRFIHLVVGFILVAIGSYLVFSSIGNVGDDREYIITPNGNRITIERVVTPVEQMKGLSGRESLDKNSGMLFVYDSEAEGRCFWMPDMNFSIDIIWFNSDKQVVDLAQEVAPETYPQTFCPENSTQYVLEVNSGGAVEFGYEVGAQARF